MNGEPLEARVREASVTMTALDGDSLLSPPLLARVVSAVLAALSARDQAEARRRRDTRADGGGCDDGEHA